MGSFCCKRQRNTAESSLPTPSQLPTNTELNEFEGCLTVLAISPSITSLYVYDLQVRNAIVDATVLANSICNSRETKMVYQGRLAAREEARDVMCEAIRKYGYSDLMTLLINRRLSKYSAPRGKN